MLSITRDTAGEAVSITISGDATVREGNELKAALLDALGSAPAVKVVIGRTETVDISLPQLLCAAHRMAADRKKTFTVEGTDQQPLADLLEQAGFLRHIGCNETTLRTCLWTCRPTPQ